MIEIVVKFEIEDGDQARMTTVLALTESGGEIVSVTGKSTRVASAPTLAIKKTPRKQKHKKAGRESISQIKTDPDLLTAKEAGALIGITGGGVQWAARNNKLKKMVSGNDVRYLRAEVLAYRASRKGGKNRSQPKPSGRSPWTMTVDAAAERAGVSPDAIRDAVKAGAVSGKVVDGTLKIHPTSLGAYKRKRGAA
tara:strand:+ start:1360 stop:1944 length:585 start_codon:yes stop_codon:yes gene_type:complete